MNPHEEPLFSSEENNMLQEIGERTLRLIRQIAAGMKLSNVEVAITYDNRIDVKEFTIQGLLLPLSPEEEEEAEKKREEKVRKLLDQLKQK
ncbi:hypothetical protein [Rothia sp. P3C3.S176]|uniref:hypothetical protein n=1 Tax=Rothia sp. P3C3.S176 TaxID=2962204 RepID=UPI0020C90681|nr:hypothetical protein [Rothia sp. P3C3.S176]MCP8995045.1 hypothetical protein [Rothia sp. P3C3.S176]